MEGVILEAMIQGGPFAIFAAWLAWNNSKQNAKLDTMVSEFYTRLVDLEGKHQAEREALDRKYHDRNEQVRDRWLTVANKLEKERDEAQHKMLREQEKIMETLTTVSIRVEGMSDQIREILVLKKNS